MANQYSMTQHAKVLACPSCKQTINTSMQQCPYCSAVIDAQAAEAAAEHMSKISKACSDASYFRIAAGMMLAFFLAGFIPIIGAPGGWGFLFLLVALPVWAIVWLVRYGSIRTDDPDFARARKNLLIGLGIWAIFLAVRVALYFAAAG